jgi:hypothetical protein
MSENRAAGGGVPPCRLISDLTSGVVKRSGMGMRGQSVLASCRLTSVI